MRRSLTRIATVASFLGLVAAAPGPTEPDTAQKVSSVIARSKLTQATYALYFRNRMQHPGEELVQEWSAEFNSGSLHRVETPRDRVVADCKAQTGTWLSLVTGKIVTGPDVAGEACGINTNRQFIAMESLGRVNTQFGAADRIRLTDWEHIRTYDISADGLILRTIFEQNDSQRVTVLDVETVDLEHSLPSQNMFDEASLQTSFVPERFKAAPAS